MGYELPDTVSTMSQPVAATRIHFALNGDGWVVIAEFTEVESGRRGDRPQLEKALAAARKCPLVVAKVGPSIAGRSAKLSKSR
jgi:hypothetical protein